MLHDWRVVGQELRDLWGVDLQTMKLREFHERSPALVEVFGNGLPVTAHAYLIEILTRFMDDPLIGSLSAVLGVHPYVKSGGISQRLSDYGENVLVPKRDEKTVRHYAEKGIELLARQMTPRSVIQQRPQLVIKLGHNGEVQTLRLVLVEQSEDAPILVLMTTSAWHIVTSTFFSRRIESGRALQSEDTTLVGRWLAPVPPDLTVEVLSERIVLRTFSSEPGGFNVSFEVREPETA